MNGFFGFLKRYPLTLLTLALIWFLCFMTPPSTKLDNVIGFDKVVHFGMYFFLSMVIMYEQRKSNIGFWIVWLSCLVLPICMSGLIEILQENCTNGRRSGDVWDFVANSAGALCAWFVGRKILEKFIR